LYAGGCHGCPFRELIGGLLQICVRGVRAEEVIGGPRCAIQHDERRCLRAGCNRRGQRGRLSRNILNRALQCSSIGLAHRDGLLERHAGVATVDREGAERNLRSRPDGVRSLERCGGILQRILECLGALCLDRVALSFARQDLSEKRVRGRDRDAIELRVRGCSAKVELETVRLVHLKGRHFRAESAIVFLTGGRHPELVVLLLGALLAVLSGLRPDFD